MGRELWVVWSGRARRDPWEELCGDYRQRIERFLPVHDVCLRPKEGTGKSRLAEEAAAVQAALPAPCRMVALDRRGEVLSSQQLSQRLQRWQEEWPHPLVFVLGSDLGLDEALAENAFLRLSLGALTLPHQLARLVCYEQLYRGLSLAAGIKYHRGPL